MKTNTNYLIEFQHTDLGLNQAGFEVCLALATLDLPLNIVVNVYSDALTHQLKSLTDYGMVDVYLKTSLTDQQYQSLKQGSFYLAF